MITIGKPYIQEKEGRSYLISHITDEKQGVDADIWYSTPSEYGQYLTDEVADAFLLCSLMPAICQKEDIRINAPVSEQLYHNIMETAAPLVQNEFCLDSQGNRLSLREGVSL